ncbi:MAG: hypothetical protein LEGION0398_MBIBDBAK_00361 [Legionellaceae bacterium]
MYNKQNRHFFYLMRLLMKFSFIFILLAISNYIGAIIAQRYELQHKSILTFSLQNLFTFFALIFHGILLNDWINTVNGQILTIFALFSLVAGFTGFITFLVGLAKPMGYLKMIISFLSILSIVLVISLPQVDIIKIENDPRQFIHILITTAAVSVFYLAGLQALCLSIQEYQLRHKRIAYMISAFPSLETMEKLVIQILTVGFILLTGVLIISFWYYHTLFNFLLIQKAFISILAWLIFVILLFGRIKYGWRGQIIARWTLGGVILLSILYFGSDFFV